MGNFGFAEMVLIAVVAFLVFGPDRLPELARQAAKVVHRFRTETSRSVEELKKAADLQDLDHEIRNIGRDLKDVRSSVTKAITQPPRGPRADDAPPPTDPEAT